ncbi:hypothetical protein [Escherichia coli]|uniref:hypothetical protein n=1 Tax=Escherichia coli TaxID=562 RepID=UPI002FF2B428
MNDVADFAVVANENNIVENVIVAEAGFSLENYKLVLIKDGVFCSIGMVYNPLTNNFE